MPLTTSSAGTIIYSGLLTEFAVTGHYLVHFDILRNKTSTQQSTWMEAALEDGSGAGVALEGGIGRWHWAMVEDIAAALSSSGTRRTCNNGVSISVVKA
jgi:hypothetical protein